MTIEGVPEIVSAVLGYLFVFLLGLVFGGVLRWGNVFVAWKRRAK